MMDTSPLAKAIATLDEALVALECEPANAFIRDASIQRFEYTYELSHKLLKRFLSETEPNPSDVNELTFSDLIRLGSARGLLDTDWADWRVFRAARNRTSHTYDEAQAAEVIETLPGFLAAAKFLLIELTERSAKLQ